MATYYSYCRRVGDKFGECSIRERGGRCIDCGNLAWIKRQKSENYQENNNSDSTNKEVSETNS